MTEQERTTLPPKRYTMDEIKHANRARGYFWFSLDTLRFFRGRVGTTAYNGPGGIYFVSSEQFVPSNGRPAPRGYTVRQFNPDTADIGTFGPFNRLTAVQARQAAKLAAQDPEAAARLIASWGR